MKAHVLGCRRVDFTDDQSQRRLCGYSLFFSYPAQGVTGEMADKKFLADEFCSARQISPPSLVGKNISLDFSPKGQLTDITVDAK